MLSKNEIERLLKDKTVAVEIYDELESTNSIGVEHAKQQGAGTTPKLLIARNQTKGKGTRGRRFFCGRDKGLYMSLVWFPDADIKTAHLATPAAGVAVAKTLRELAGVDAKIKWVNDIVIDDKKICGILAESKLRSQDQSAEYIVIGIGINLYGGDFPPEIASIATALDEHFANFDVNELCADIVNHLLEHLKNLCEAEFMVEYKAMSSILGRDIVFENGGLPITGRAVDINKQGNLVVEVADKRYIVTAGDVSIKALAF